MNKPLPDALRLVADGDFLTAGGIKVLRLAADEIDRLRKELNHIQSVGHNPLTNKSKEKT